MNFGNYIKQLKLYSKRKEISNELFVNELLLPLVKSENIKNKDGDVLYLDKSRVSNLLRHKDNVPEALTETLDKDDVEEKIQEYFSKFYNKYIDTSRDEELHTEFFNYIKNDSISQKEKNYILSDDTCTMLLRLFLSTLKQNNKELLSENMIIWQRGKNYIKIIEGDLFKFGFDRRSKNNRIIVIPVDTTFETRLSGDAEIDNIMLVSRETIHGEFLNRLYIKGLSPSEISKRITMNLNKNNATSRNSVYPIGTIAVLKFDNSIFFLLAVSKFGKKNIARSTKKDIEVAIRQLFKYYEEKGQGYDIFVPLIGTGMSRASLYHQESYDIIKNTLIKNKNKLQGKINITILPEVINSIEI